MPDLLAGLEDYCRLLSVPSRDYGTVSLATLMPSQTYLVREFRRGLEDDVHDFLVLKGGRQSAVGGSTVMDAVSLFLLQSFSGLVGLMVSDEDDNRDYRRDVMLTMLDSLPRPHRQDVRRDNNKMLAWRDNPKTGYRGSRLLFAAAGKREDKNVGRSKGINFNYNDEFGFWVQKRVYGALRASRSEVHPQRFYCDISTANGINTLMHEQWKLAAKATTRRRIFVSCWRNQEAGCRIARTDRRWGMYGEPRLTTQERDWRRIVKRRYDVALTDEFFAWYRWKCAEDMSGDETMMAQEYGILPEDCFVSFGDHFVPTATIARLRAACETFPASHGYRYEWGPYLDNTTVEDARVKDAPLVIYEEPDPNAVYVVAAHPWGSSSPQARAHVCQVWRAWPDKLRLVAEFYDEAESMYHFAWACLHLTAAYKTWSPVYFILEIGMSGAHVLTEIDRISNLSYGLSPEAQANKVTSFIESIQYLYRRADSFGASVLRQVKSTAEIRARLLYGLRDEVEREHVEIGNPALIDELASLRRGEAGDADEIEGGGDAPEARAITAGMAVLAWLEQAMPDLLAYIPPKEETGGPRHVAEALVGAHLSRVMRRG